MRCSRRCTRWPARVRTRGSRPSKVRPSETPPDGRQMAPVAPLGVVPGGRRRRRQVRASALRVRRFARHRNRAASACRRDCARCGTAGTGRGERISACGAAALRAPARRGTGPRPPAGAHVTPPFRIDMLDGPADLDGIQEVDRLSFPSPWTRAMYEEEFQHPGTAFIIVLRTGTTPVAGYCSYRLVADELQVNNVAVSRNTGERVTAAPSWSPPLITDGGRRPHRPSGGERSNLAARRLYVSLGSCSRRAAAVLPPSGGGRLGSGQGCPDSWTGSDGLNRRDPCATVRLGTVSTVTPAAARGRKDLHASSQAHSRASRKPRYKEAESMTVNVQDHRSMLLQTDDEFRQLAPDTRKLEQRLAELAGKTHLTEPEHLEQRRSRSGSCSSRIAWKTSCGVLSKRSRTA